MNLGIEADLIVMHPYDRWGFSMMKAEDDDRYWKYVLARFSAYRNVWWSLANEYDLMHEKTLSDWERYASIICEKDPYHHLRSITAKRIMIITCPGSLIAASRELRHTVPLSW